MNTEVEKKHKISKQKSDSNSNSQCEQDNQQAITFITGNKNKLKEVQ